MTAGLRYGNNGREVAPEGSEACSGDKEKVILASFAYAQGFDKQSFPSRPIAPSHFDLQTLCRRSTKTSIVWLYRGGINLPHSSWFLVLRSA